MPREKTDVDGYMSAYKRQLNDIYMKCRTQYVIWNGGLTREKAVKYKERFTEMMYFLFADWLQIYRYFGINANELFNWIYCADGQQLQFMELTEDMSITTVRNAVFDYIDSAKETIDPTDTIEVRYMLDNIQMLILRNLYNYNAFLYDFGGSND